MKRVISVLILSLLIPVMVSAGFSYQFDILSLHPLFAEYTADRDRAALDFQWLFVDEFPREVYQDTTRFDFGTPRYDYSGPATDNGSGDVNDGYEAEPMMGIIHLGETLGLFRHTFEFDSLLSPISFGLAFQGTLKFGMEGGMADTIGYDGIFFYGGEFRIADMISMRIGAHHFCSHYGDGTLKYLGLDTDRLYQKGFNINYKNLRMDDLAIGLSIEPIEGMRIYGEYLYTPKFLLQWIEPKIFAPLWYDNTGLVQGKTDDYRAQVVCFGIELSYPIFPGMGRTTLSYDCTAYEEGQILYTDEDLAGRTLEEGRKAIYDPTLPWEFEHELVLSQELGRGISFEVGYHHGRFPMNAFYHHRCNYAFLGLRYNPDADIRLVDVTKV